MSIRKARFKDVKEIQTIVNHFAQGEVMLPLSLNKIYENIRDFSVVTEGDEVVAVGALHIVWDDLAEIKSMAVKEGHHKKGYATKVVNELLSEAKEIELSQVFLLTYQNEFFSKFGFKEIEKSDLPHKVWTDCVNCSKFPNCDEIGMMLQLEK